MSRYFQIAKKNYDAGLWNLAMLEHLVDLGRLTEEEVREIVGSDE